MHHFIENMGGFLVCMIPAGQVFQLPVFVYTAVFCLGRVLHQTGYTTGGYGSHGVGFLLSMLATAGVEGLCLLLTIKSL
jgi:uncharacterized membrane protein YecN with MAPEG domain